MRWSNANADSDSDGKRNCKCHAYGNPDGNRGAAAYPDAKAASDARAAPDSITVTGTIKAGTRERNSRVPPLPDVSNDL